MSNSIALTIGAAIVRQVDGLYSLNDLHKASGGESGARPGEFMRNQQTQGLISEIVNAGISAFVSRKGRHGGTYACKELVIAYAAWISAAFHLKVIRVFLNSVSGKLPQRRAYHFPLATADVHDRFYANTWLTPERLTDPKNQAPELDLIQALERDGHDVTGAKVRILAMRDAMNQMVEMREALMAVSTLAKRAHDFADVAREKRGKNVLFVGKPDPRSAIDRHVYRDQLGAA